MPIPIFEEPSNITLSVIDEPEFHLVIKLAVPEPVTPEPPPPVATSITFPSEVTAKL